MAPADSDPPNSRETRLALSSYNSPYSHAGAPTPYPNTSPYAPLRAQAIDTLSRMGYDPSTMVERGVVWAEDQDPFSHVMQSRYMDFLGLCFHRVMESYDEFLSEEEYQGMITGKTIVPMVRKYELQIKRQVKYPDALIAAFREDGIEPTRNHGTTCLFSLKQQVIVAEVKGSTTYVDVKSGRPVDIRAVGGGWSKLFEGFTKKAESAKMLKEKWEVERARAGKPPVSKI